MEWNLGDVFETAERAVPQENPAPVHGDRVVSWGALARRSNALILVDSFRSSEALGFGNAVTTR